MRVIALHPERLQVRVAHGEPEKSPSIWTSMKTSSLTRSRTPTERTDIWLPRVMIDPETSHNSLVEIENAVVETSIHSSLLAKPDAASAVDCKLEFDATKQHPRSDRQSLAHHVVTGEVRLSNGRYVPQKIDSATHPPFQRNILRICSGVLIRDSGRYGRKSLTFLVTSNA